MPPSMADIEQSTGNEPVQSLARAILDHAALAAALGEAAPEVKPSQCQVFTSFQSHLMTLGRFVGLAKRGQSSSAPGLVACCTDFLKFLNNVQPDGAGSSYRVSQVRAAAGLAIKAMIQAALLHGEGTYADVVEKIIGETTRNGGNLRGSLALRQDLATRMFDCDGDAGAAAPGWRKRMRTWGTRARRPSKSTRSLVSRGASRTLVMRAGLASCWHRSIGKPLATFSLRRRTRNTSCGDRYSSAPARLIRKTGSPGSNSWRACLWGWSGRKGMRRPTG